MFEFVSLLMHVGMLGYMVCWLAEAEHTLFTFDFYEGRIRLDKRTLMVMIVGIIVCISLGSHLKSLGKGVADVPDVRRNAHDL